MLSSKIKTAIIDDHPLVRSGLVKMLESMDSVIMIGEYEKGTALLEDFKFQQPDLLFLDLQLPEKNGDELLSIIKKNYPKIKILILTSNDSIYQIKKMLNAGADGYILKNSPPEQLKEAIEHIFDATQETPYLQAAVKELLYKTKQKEHTTLQQTTALTPRETEILQLIAQEMTSHEIGELLHLHYRTIEIYRLGIMRKLGAKNMVGMVKKAILMGIVKE